MCGPGLRDFVRRLPHSESALSFPIFTGHFLRRDRHRDSRIFLALLSEGRKTSVELGQTKLKLKLELKLELELELKLELELEQNWTETETGLKLQTPN